MSSVSSTFTLVFVTASSEAEAAAIARYLVERQLAACVSVMPIRSIYRWQDEIQDEAEWQLVIKTRLAHWDQVTAEIQRLHSYEVPEIIAVPIVAGSESYLTWLAAQVAPA